jgi:hypothetical protein
MCREDPINKVLPGTAIDEILQHGSGMLGLLVQTCSCGEPLPSDPETLENEEEIAVASYSLATATTN